jgi:hypothetical protein
MASAAVQASPITYQGTLISGVPVSGSVSGDGWGNEDASGIAFWRFSANAGDSVTIQANHSAATPGLDLVFSLYFGTTTADESEFISDAQFGTAATGILQYLTFDDESGGNSDPLLTDYVLPFGGFYTIALGGFFGDAGNYQLVSTVTSAAAVPLPGTVLLVGAALLGLGWSRSKYKTSGRLPVVA